MQESGDRAIKRLRRNGFRKGKTVYIAQLPLPLGEFDKALVLEEVK